MKVLGIISEYNPFHYGHRYHIEQSKKSTSCDYTVAVMSGPIVQRGDFAILEPHRRAKTAIENGVDLVLELPVCYSSQSAEIFAYGSINILNRLGFVNNISCGSETNNLDDINKIVPLLTKESISYNLSLKNQLSKGLSFPKARSQAILELTGMNLQNTPNDILTLEYAKAIEKLNSSINLTTIKRKGQDYNSPLIEGDFPSATAIRKAFKEGCFSPAFSPETALESYGKLIDNFNFLKLLVFREDLKIRDTFDLNEGLENSIIANIKKANSKEELIDLLKSKRYTHTRISRILNNILLGLDKASMTKVIYSQEKPYAKILALNSKGRQLLGQTDKEQITLINKPATFIAENQLQQTLWHYDTIAYNMYLSLSKEKYISQNQISPIIL
ncbi:MAG: tRNA(Met) cytidine acetate ligase [Filifactoraceae bacterium]